MRTPKLVSTLVLGGFAIAALPFTARAQVLDRDRIAESVGKSVTVTTVDGQRHRGALRALTATEVTVADLSGDRSLPLAGVRTVVRDSRAVAKGALFGLAAATGFVVAACASGACTGDESSMGAEGLLGIAMVAGLGAAAGAGVGALVRSPTSARTLFSAGSTTSVIIGPVFGRGRIAVATSVRW
jgi:hypothetical protein